MTRLYGSGIYGTATFGGTEHVIGGAAQAAVSASSTVERSSPISAVTAASVASFASIDIFTPNTVVLSGAALASADASGALAGDFALAGEATPSVAGRLDALVRRDIGGAVTAVVTASARVGGDIEIGANASAGVVSQADATVLRELFSLDAEVAVAALCNMDREEHHAVSGRGRGTSSSSMDAIRIQQPPGRSVASVLARGVLGVNVAAIPMPAEASVTSTCNARLLWEPAIVPDDIWTQQRVA